MTITDFILVIIVLIVFHQYTKEDEDKLDCYNNYTLTVQKSYGGEQKFEVCKIHGTNKWVLREK